MYKKNKYYIYLLLNSTQENGKWNKAIKYFLITLITLNVVVVIFETLDGIYNLYNLYFRIFEKISVYIFTIEYLLRLWTCTCETKFRRPILGRLQYIFSFGALVDLFVFVPFYLPFTRIDLRIICILRLFRVLRISKLSRYLNATKLISNVFKSPKEELVLCFAEHQAQSDKYSSTPATIWWCIITLTTVGYSDVCSIAVTGKILTTFIAILGIRMFALPAGFLASEFSDDFQKKNKENFFAALRKNN